MDFILYGSYGFTGDLVARLAVERGMQPLLSGRDAEKLRKQADALSLPCKAAALDDPAALDDLLKGTPVVLHCAGPFSHTSRPMADACLRTGAHYLDITGEIDVFEALAARDAEARAAGVMLLPGIGFDVAPSDCLAVHLKRRLPQAKNLTIAIMGISRASRGTTRTSIESLGRAARERVRGKIVSVPGVRLRQFDFGRGLKTAVAIGWGDVATAYHSTGIPNIETFMALPQNMIRMMKVSTRLPRLFGSRPMQGLLKRAVGLLPAGPNGEQREKGLAILVGEAGATDGRRVRSRLRTPEAYKLTSLTALAAVEKLLAEGEAAKRSGFQTPAKAFGADFILEIPGCEREDLK